MASRLNPYLSFSGQRPRGAGVLPVRSAAAVVSTFGEFGDEGPTADQVMHGQLETAAGFTLMAADTPRA